MQPPDTLVVTALHRPGKPADYVERARLMAPLDRSGDRSLLLVSAPAGCGKTTLVSAWLEARGWPAGWISLHGVDPDLPRLLGYLAAALERAGPASAPGRWAWEPAAAPPSPWAAAAGLANALAALDHPLILVVDDYQRVGDPRVHAFFDRLLQLAPAGLRLVLVTRQDPPLALAGLRAAGRLVELRAAALCFDPGETAEFMRNATGSEVDGDLVERLQTETLGWPAAVRLAALNLGPAVAGGPAPSLDPAPPAEPGAPPLGGRYLVDFMVAEVLDRQPPPLQAFLLRTAILERFCGPLAAALLGPGPAPLPVEDMLRQLDSMNLFLVHLDSTGDWYRYHSLFRRLLLRELWRRLPAEEIAGLYRRASEWLAGAGYVEDALAAALAGEDLDGAAAILAARRPELVARGDWRRLERWLGQFPAERIDQDADLQLAAAWLALYRLDRAAVVAATARAESLLPSLADEASRRRLAGEARLLRAYQPYWAGDAEGILREAEAALAALPEADWELRLEARKWQVTAHRMRGDLRTAQRALAAALQGSAGRRPEARAGLLLTDAVLAWMGADLDRAAESAGAVLARFGGPDTIEASSWSRYLLGAIHLHRDALDAAERQLGELNADRYHLPLSVACHAALALASVYQAQGRPQEARALADALPGFLHETGSPSRLPTARAFQAELALAQDRLAEARRWASTAEPPAPDESPFYFVAQLTRVKVRLALGGPADIQSAQAELAPLLAHYRTAGNVRVTIACLALRAALLAAEGRRETACQALAEALTLAEPGGFLRPFIELGESLGALLVRLGAEGLAPAYLARLQAALAAAGSRPRPAGQAELVEPLTDRELEVLAGLAERLSNREIAQRLVISPETVKRHTLHIYQKLRVPGRREAVAKARALGLLGLP